MTLMDDKNFGDWDNFYKENKVEEMPWYNANLDANLENYIKTNNLHSGKFLDLGTGPGTQAIQLDKLGVDVTGTDVDSGDTTFIFQTTNVIEDITNVVNPTETHTVFTLRLNNNRTRLGLTAQFSNTFTGDKRPIFPKFIGAGQVKFVSQQKTGALQAHSIIITTRTPLVA